MGLNGIKYSWRNLWRNARRTQITMAALVLNTAILIISYGLIVGYIDGAVRTATEVVVGEAQIHAEGYLKDRSLYKQIENAEGIMDAARENGLHAAGRTYGYGLISVGNKSAGSLFWGVNPSDEKQSFRLAEYMETGEFLPDLSTGQIVLGKKLAKSLHAEPGSEMIVVVQAADGSIGSEIYHVSGILKSAGSTLDRTAAILHEDDFRELFAFYEGYHEIALNSFGSIPTLEIPPLLQDSLGESEIKTWHELIPAFSDLINLSESSSGILLYIFFIAAGLGVMNTMLMATFERTREFGILKALGTSPWKIIFGVITEAFLMCFAATIIGIVLGIAGGYYFQVIGIDTAKFAGETSFTGIAFDPIWRAKLTPDGIVKPVIQMWIACVLSAIYPAVLAARLEPVKAMKHV